VVSKQRDAELEEKLKIGERVLGEKIEAQDGLKRQLFRSAQVILEGNEDEAWKEPLTFGFRDALREVSNCGISLIRHEREHNALVEELQSLRSASQSRQSTRETSPPLSIRAGSPAYESMDSERSEGDESQDSYDDGVSLPDVERRGPEAARQRPLELRAADLEDRKADSVRRIEILRTSQRERGCIPHQEGRAPPRRTGIPRCTSIRGRPWGH
jgi:hypothetical protein